MHKAHGILNFLQGWRIFRAFRGNILKSEVLEKSLWFMGFFSKTTLNKCFQEKFRLCRKEIFEGGYQQMFAQGTRYPCFRNTPKQEINYLPNPIAASGAIARLRSGRLIAMFAHTKRWRWVSKGKGAGSCLQRIWEYSAQAGYSGVTQEMIALT